jgi:hypothetical protein
VLPPVSQSTHDRRCVTADFGTASPASRPARSPPRQRGSTIQHDRRLRPPSADRRGFCPPTPGDQACACAALKRLLRLDPAGRASLGEQKPAGEEPIFQLRTRPPAAARANAAPCWQAVHTTHMDAYARRVARAVSLPPADVGGHSFRIGGATDFIDGGGSHEQLRGRGRWASDIGHIYARDTIGLQLGSVDAIVQANTMSIKELIAGYTQPARR